MNVRWQPYVWKEPRPVDPVELEKLESAWGVQLPEEYKDIAPHCHGMMPRPEVFDIGRGDNVFTCLLTLTLDEHHEGYAISTIHRLIEPYVPPGIFPFGMTPGGENLCFDYRGTPPGQPKVVLVTTDMKIYFIAHGFREFLEALRD